MKDFKSYNEFAACTMAENLTIARLCLETPKKSETNSCYGMSAVILLSAVIDALGMFYREGTTIKLISPDEVKCNRLGRASKHFEYYYDKFMSSSCYEKLFFVKEFYDFVRCRATHNNVLGPKINITINKSVHGLIFEKKHEDASWQVYLNELYEAVKSAYEMFLLESGINIDEKYQPTTGGTISTQSSKA